MSVGICQSICLGYPDLQGEFAVEVVAVAQSAVLFSELRERKLFANGQLCI